MKRRDVFKLAGAAIAALGLGGLAANDPPGMEVTPKELTRKSPLPMPDATADGALDLDSFSAEGFTLTFQEDPGEPVVSGYANWDEAWDEFKFHSFASTDAPKPGPGE